jgi:hypothetical protein
MAQLHADVYPRAQPGHVALVGTDPVLHAFS